jgi:DNA-directed RNA polymerase subunit beta'
MILGVYYLSTEQKNKIGEGTIFASTSEALRAYALNQVHPHTIVGISTTNYPHKHFSHSGILITTVGKIILNNVLPEDMVYVNDVDVPQNLPSTNIVERGNDPREAISK